ncbi:MAG: hypothetical protein H0V56_13815 [Chthoniobacterales bacterium]|nr:hypothetical protein [Chthoniobacterales bacterium]
MLIRVYDAAADLQRVCLNKDWRFCLIGGVALLRWSDPRMTDAADITLFTDFGEEEKFVDGLMGAFAPRVSNAREVALRGRVLLLRHPNGVALDVALGAFPFEQRTIERSSLWQATAQHELRTCSAEDLVVHKAFASRGQDWVDIENVIQRQGKKLNVRLILQELEPLAALKEQPEIVDQLRSLLSKHLVG